ncbi:DUF7260 family protein [Halobellus ordinarius]|uniref:DUF7260 family protein n=1 Tax=Halobellus ordinarius TaxID=3075120 RepID=UPI0028803452|nr:hypothetical protein [Halobellus sp. ZY16]
MVPEPVLETEGILSLLDTLRSSIQQERRCLRDEREAFDDFRSRLESIEPTKPDHAAGVTQPLQVERTVGLDSVRNAYESTVMSVPHYDAEYGDTYEQSVTEEFGPEVGLLLTEGNCFDQRLKTALREKIRQCRRERDQFLQTLEIEADSVGAVENRLRPITDELRTFSPECSGTESYGALEAEWNRLRLLATKVDRIAGDRQTAIKRQRDVFNLTPEAPDIPTYLYLDFEDNYPLLSALVDIQRTIEAYQSEREYALSER